MRGMGTKPRRPVSVISAEARRYLVLGTILALSFTWSAQSAAVAAPSLPSPDSLAAASVGVTLTGFQDTVVWSGLTNPTVVRFASDGRVFVAEKSGIIKVFDGLADPIPTTFADLRTNVDNYWDRGLLGMALDPAFPVKPYVFVAYAYDAPPGAVAPRWNDACPTPPGPTSDGCVVTGRLSRLTAAGGTASVEDTLITDWCQQYPSHSMGALQFGSDGALYMTAGEGAGITFVDYGNQGGGSGSPTAANPCGDPPTGAGLGAQPPDAEGGALRSQSLRRSGGGSVVLGGTLLRLDAANGLAKSDNPLASNPDLNARRIVGYGLRNPFRFAIRPGTTDIWIGDVGWDDWEEIDRVADPLGAVVANMGWPCYEGNAQQSAYMAVGLNACSTLYKDPTSLLAPYFAYNHTAHVASGEACPIGSSSISGLAFYPGGPYPATYDGALFFADHSRRCIWAMLAGQNGLPNPARIVAFDTAAANPIDLVAGPDGDLFYVDFEGGSIHRIRYSTANQPPTASIVARPPSGPSPLTVALDGSGSTDPEGGPLTYSWDLDGNGTLGDSSLAKPTRTFRTAGTHSVRLRVTDQAGLSRTSSIDVLVDDSLPRPVIDGPVPARTWKVGERIAFSGHATDGGGAAIPAAGLSWTLDLYHCPSNCHVHTIQSWDGVSSGSFEAPDHDYPSYLSLTLIATDALGRQARSMVALQPRTVDLMFQTAPSGLKLVIGTHSEATAPFHRRVIVGSAESLSAATPQTLGGSTYSLLAWSDGLPATHLVTAPESATTYTARFARVTSLTTYLSDLAGTVVANGWGPLEPDRSNGEKGLGDGAALTLDGVVYAKGLGTSADSEVRYAIHDCSRFTARVGIDDEVGANGSVVFQVWTDGRQAYDSGLMTGIAKTQTVSVDLTGKSALRLVVTDGGDDIAADHADWADAKIRCSINGSADRTAPTITRRTPSTNATGVTRAIHPTATFSEPLNPKTVSRSTVILTNAAGGQVVPDTVAYDSRTRTAIIRPTSSLAAHTTYRIRVRGGAAGVKDVAGNALSRDVIWTFRTR